MNVYPTLEREALAEEFDRTILIVDDHRSFAELLGQALGSVPGLSCIATASSVAESLTLIARLRPGVVVMDIQMPDEDGLAGTRRVVQEFPDTLVAIVSAHRDPEWVARAARAGASAFIPKNGSLSEMIDILRRVRHGQMLVAPSALGYGNPTGAAADHVDLPELTHRELEVLTLLGQGLHPKGIGRDLGITLATCRGYLKSIHRKLGVRTQLEAVIRAQQLGLIGFPDEA